MRSGRVFPGNPEQWDETFAAAAANPGTLERALIERWTLNAPTLAPLDLTVPGTFVHEYGWSAALETYLLDKETRDNPVEVLVTAVQAASAVCDTELMHDVWLADVLALRRVPPLSRRETFRGIVEQPDIDTANVIVDSLSRIARRLPTPDSAAYAYFSAIYDMITIATVSEIVEVDSRIGTLAVRYHSGMRPFRPEVRSLFGTIAAGRSLDNTNRRIAVLRKMATVVEQLVDGLAFLNPRLETLARLNATNAAVEPALEEFAGSLSRYFDDSFYRLLAADPRAGERQEALMKGLELLHRHANRLGPPAGLYVDAATIQAKMWAGRLQEAQVDQLVIVREDGTIDVAENVVGVAQAAATCDD